MNKRILLIFLTLFFLQFSFVYSQSANNLDLDKSFLNSLSNAGLKEDVINNIKLLLSQKKEADLENQKLQIKSASTYPIKFKDDVITEEYNNKKFILALSKIITIDQFQKVFQSQLQYKIDRVSNDKWELAKEKYKLTKEQEKKYKNLLYQNTINEIIVREYYSYDDNLSWNNYTEEKIKSSGKEFEMIKDFGLHYSINSKTDALIQKLKEAKIDSERINQIILALQVLQERNDKRLKTWRENDSANIFNFHDPGDDEYAIYLDFREQLSKILKIEEFKSVFVSQLQNRIIRDSEKEFKTVKANYMLTDLQYNEIQKLILEKNTEKVVTEEYYKYSYELYQQKLRAVEYRHEKVIRETIQKFNVSKS